MKTIVITGASSGIGAALARHLGREGHRLVLAARRIEQLNAVANESGPNTVTVRADVTRRDDVNRLRDEALRAFETVDVWVNNAGRGITRPALELTDEDVDEMMAINVKSALYGAQAVAPHFLQRGRGHLINISSFLGRVPLATHRSAYNAAKAALNALTANLRVDLHRKNPAIHVSLVMPGLVSTDFARNVRGEGAAAAPPWTPGGGAPQPAMKPQSPEEVASAIAGLIEKPVAEIYTNPASREMARRYFEDIDAFEAGM
ncbi:MAG TPA: SDR family oxidoreductase [Thermoanaerobaculia bacterium]|nr:SDR family oxidoreductase [Thermoanaerobaculia bacterium]